MSEINVKCISKFFCIWDILHFDDEFVYIGNGNEILLNIFFPEKFLSTLLLSNFRKELLCHKIKLCQQPSGKL